LAHSVPAAATAGTAMAAITAARSSRGMRTKQPLGNGAMDRSLGALCDDVASTEVCLLQPEQDHKR